MKSSLCRISLVLSLLAAGMAPSAAQNTKSDFFFPPDAGIVNVLEYGALPGDGKDDTAAIQKALDAFPAGHKIIYLPNGVYHVTETLRWPAGENQGQNMKYTTLQGESRDGVVLQVMDGSPKFADPKAPSAVIFTGGGPAQRFGNEVRDLTVHTGKGNPGAIGIQFNASNYGCLRHVKILSGDGKGVIGLDMAFVGEVGPLLVKDLEVEGFDYGVKTQENEASQTLENIILKNQNVCGIYNRHQSVFIRNLVTEGGVTAVWNDDHAGQIVLVDAKLTGTGAAKDVPAVIQSAGAYAFLRNVKTSGFQMAIRAGESENNVPGPDVAEWPSSPPRSLFNAPPTSLNLPVKETPDVPLDRDLKNWADVRAFGAKAGDDADDTEAIQAAIDSGKSTVWFPAASVGGEGFFKVNGTLRVRGNVSRLIGYSGVITGDGTVRFEDGSAPVVVAERMAFGFFGNIKMEIATKRTVVVKDCSVDKGITHTGSGEFFIENVVAGKCTFQGGPVYARQLNPEVPGVHLLADGAQVWILGMKVEVKGTIMEVRNNATLEMLGLFVYASHVLDKSPMMVVENAKLSISFREKTNFAESYPVIVRETRGEETREWVNAEGGGSAAPLFLAIPVKATAVPAPPTNLRMRAMSPSEVTVSWTDASDNEEGFIIERLAPKSKEWKTAGRAGLNETKFSDHGLAVEADYQYRVRATNSAGPSEPTPPGDVTTLRTTTAPNAPEGFSATTPIAGEVVLKWRDASNNEDSFLIERRTADGKWTALPPLPPDSSTYRDEKIKPETTLAYRISAINAIGASPVSPEQQLTTLPEGLIVADFGQPQIAGQTFYDPAKKLFTLQAGGLEVWGRTDQFYFAFREMSGDVTVTARVPSFTGGEYYAKAGVMIRATKALDSAHAFMSVGPGNLAYFSNRRTPGGDSAQDQGLDSGKETKWVRLVRSGNAVRGYYSKAENPTDKDWTALGLPTPVEFNDPVLVGLVAVSQSDVKTATAVFEGFSIEPRAVVPVATEPTPPPAPPAGEQAAPVAVESSVGITPVLRSGKGSLPEGWTSYDINGPELSGGAVFDPAKKLFSVTGSGGDIWGGMDQFQFTSREMTGDGEIVAQIPYMEETGSFAKSGLMIRGSLDANAPFAFLTMKPDKQVNFTWRAATGTAVEQSGWTGDMGVNGDIRWMKITRAGNLFTAFVSMDGKSWTPVGEPKTCQLPSPALAGFAVCATSLSATNLTIFGDVTVTGGKDPSQKPKKATKE